MDKVDQEDRINESLPELDKMISEGLITLERVQVITYKHNSNRML